MAHMRIPLDRRADRAGRLPLSRQIQLHIERLIGQRLLAAGAKLPATRELARDLGVNRTTVALAYDELVGRVGARARGAGDLRGGPGARRRGGAAHRAALRLDGTPLQERPGHRGGRAPPSGLGARPSPRARSDLVRGGHAGQRPLSHRRVSARPQPRDPRGRARAPPVLSRARVSPVARIPGRAICCASASRRAPRRSSSSTAPSRGST